MKKFVICAAVLCCVWGLNTASANDIDNMLFGSAKKITAAPKDNPLIPHLVTDDAAPPTKKLLIKKQDTKQAVEEEPLPEVSALPRAKQKNKKEQKSLTDKIKQVENKAEEEKDSILKDTWVEKLSSSIKSKKESDKAESLESLTRNAKKSGRSNASVFDISGVMLRMSMNQAESMLLKRGYKMVAKKFEIPNFIRWRYEEQCRNSGVIGYERLNNCVVKAAQANNHQYAETAKFVKYDSQEEINIWLTSNFTNNKVYKITYSTGITNVNRGSGQKIQYLHNIKTFEFWKRINQKYGTPDNKTEILWGLGGNKPYMKAVTGKLLLEDPMLRELDYTRMSREDARFINTNMYNF
ncbi:MAG: hypothetical protein IJ689_00520 [Alphaproteobacteria bacterium]|nr:hypothetical protein [Alphaproteobacteria bacterium]